MESVIDNMSREAAVKPAVLNHSLLGEITLNDPDLSHISMEQKHLDDSDYMAGDEICYDDELNGTVIYIEREEPLKIARDKTNACDYIVNMSEKGSEYMKKDDELLISLKNKLVDLNETHELQIEQNSENHHLEEVQKLKESQENLENKVAQPNKSINVLNQLDAYSAKQLGSSIEEYLNEIAKNSVNDKAANDINKVEVQIEKCSKMSKILQNTDNIVHGNFQDKIYQTPPMRQIPDFVDRAGSFSEQKLKAPTQNTLFARHLYQNLPYPLSYRQSPTGKPVYRAAARRSPLVKMPTYVNVPVTKRQQCKTDHPYSRIWPDARRESDSDIKYNDGNCQKGTGSVPITANVKTRRSSSPGYVQMTSPFVRSPMRPIFVQLASNLANYAKQSLKAIFCPLCPRQLSNERLLANHIHKSHRLELESIIDDKSRNLQFNMCPVCNAKFLNSSVLSKHLVDCHKDSVIPLLEKHKCLVSNGKCMQCPFCIKSVPSSITGEHIMLFHLQQYHLTRYQEMINSICRIDCINNGQMKKEMQADFEELFGMASGPNSTPELSGKMNALLVHSDSKRKFEDMENDENIWTKGISLKKTPTAEKYNKRVTKSYEKSEPRRSVSKGILRKGNDMSNKSAVKRELRFSEPHVTREQVYYPESPGPETPDYKQQIETKVFTFATNFQSDQQCRSQIEDSKLTSAELINMNQQFSRKRRRIGLSLKSGRIFRCKDKENNEDKLDQQIYTTCHTRTFRKPRVEESRPVRQVANGSPCASKLYSTNIQQTVNNTKYSTNAATNRSLSYNALTSENNTGLSCTEILVADEPGFVADSLDDSYPLSSVKLYSPLRLFRCNGCRHKFCDNVSLVQHINEEHRSWLAMLRPQYGCGVCAAKFYENKYLVKHCIQHHMSLLEIRNQSASSEVDTVTEMSRRESKVLESELVTTL